MDICFAENWEFPCVFVTLEKTYCDYCRFGHSDPRSRWVAFLSRGTGACGLSSWVCHRDVGNRQEGEGLGHS